MAIKRHVKRYPTHTSPARGAGLFGGRVRPLRDTMYERLQLESLEARQMMTIAPQDVVDQLVTLPPGSVVDQYDRSANTVAIDNDGDFVTTWTRTEFATDPITGKSVQDTNIYARYFTDEVQRLTLPGSAVGGGIALTHLGSHVLQKVSITGEGSVPFSLGGTPQFPGGFANRISGSFVLGMDIDEDGAIGEFEQVTVNLGDPEGMQAALRSLGGPLAEVQVQAVGDSAYYLSFPAEALSGSGFKKVVVVDYMGLSGGYLPTADVTTVSQPVTLADPLTGGAIRFFNDANRSVVATNTAKLIQQAFSNLGSNIYDRTEDLSNESSSFPSSFAVQRAETEVTGRYNPANDTFEFDIWFKGDSGKRDFPLLQVGLVDGSGNPVNGSVVETLKEPSAEFRVNEAEGFDPVTGAYLGNAQGNSVIAMDADGDFVIAWQSEVRNTEVFGSQSDIFARRYNSRGEAIGGQFRVNAFTANAQVDPTIGMDQAGNFVVGWVTLGQDGSFFNNIIGRRFDFNGQPLGSDFTVESELAVEQLQPHVAVSTTGFFAFTWNDLLGGINIMGKAYQPNGQPIATTAGDPDREPEAQFEFIVERINADSDALESTAAWDENGHLYVSWTRLLEPDTPLHADLGNPDRSYGIRSRMFNLNITDPLAPVIEYAAGSAGDIFRVNSVDPDRNEDSDPFWGYAQYGSQVVSDSDGDLIFLYQGYGKDTIYEPISGFLNGISYEGTDYDSALRSFLLPIMRQNTFAEQQQLTIFPGVNGPSGSFVVRIGDEDTLIENYSLFETQTITVFPDSAPPTGNYLIEFDGQTSGPIALTDGKAFLQSLQDFINPILPGAKFSLTANDGTDLNADTFPDFEAQIVFPDLVDAAQVNILPENADDTNVKSTTVSDTEPVTGVIQDLLSQRLKAGTVTVTVGEPADLNGDGINDIPMSIVWGGSAAGIDQPLVQVFRAVDELGNVIGSQEEQLITVAPEFDPLTGTYMLRFGANVVRPLTYTSPEGLVDQVRVTLNSLTGGGVFANLTSESGTDLTGDGVPDIQFRVRFSGGTAGIDQPAVEILPAVGDDGQPLPNAWQAVTKNDELVKGANAKALKGTADIRSETIVVVNGRVEEAPIRAARLAFERENAFQRGTANDIMYMPFDSDQLKAVTLPLASQSEQVVNSRRDGQNQQYIIGFRNNWPFDARWITGSFELTLPGPITVTVSWPDPESPTFIEDLETAIDDAIEGSGLYGTSYPEPNFDGPVRVEVLTNQDVFDRQATVYDLSRVGFPDYDPSTDLILQITFIGEHHDSPAFVGVGRVELLSGAPGDFGGDLGDPPPATFNFEEERRGDAGTLQGYSSVAIQPNGSWVAVWNDNSPQFSSTTRSTAFPLLTSGDNISQFPTLDTTTLNFQRYEESTDTVGPRLTEFMLPSGSRLGAGGQLTQPIEFLVVSFDENMTTTGANSITDPRNWALLKDGTSISGGIRSIEFGMNKAADLGLGPRSNKWEAVLQFDGNGANSGITTLGDGNYEIVAKNSLRDRSGNPLGRRGLTPNGQTVSRQFSIAQLGTGEQQVNQTPAGAQETQVESPKQVASDADGDYVSVWTSRDSGVDGIYASVYHSRDRGAPAQLVKQVLVTTDPGASYPSVARDASGNFVVTWSSDNGVDPETTWDVYARRYDALGNPLGEAFRVNTETENVQRYSTVAMDLDGDFVVTWQSLEQDESGYGIYAQRYNRAGEPLGGVEETQQLHFTGAATGGFFRLIVGTQITAEIPFVGNTVLTAPGIEAALEALPNVGDVDVFAVGSSDIRIVFKGADGFQDQVQILPYLASLDPPDVFMTVSTISDGRGGEFLVNSTTANDQTFPDIAMEVNGDFVITWTSAGQDGDELFERNVYARRFASNETVFPQNNSGRVDPKSLMMDPSMDLPVNMIVTTDDPANHIVQPGTGYDGVAMLVMDNGTMGTGSLLSDGRHILTAAHNVTDAFGTLSVSSVDVIFTTPTGQVTIVATRIIVHPGWDATSIGGGDLAILELETEAPPTIERYDIYRGSDEIGKTFTKVGYGLSGQGPTGATLPSGTKRVGQNVYEGLPQELEGVLFAPGSAGANTQLLYDFDSGDAANDFFATLGRPDLGLGELESSAGKGDSGGPNFIDGLIAGITAWGTTTPNDVDDQTNSSFGEIASDTRVSFYASWIDSIISGGGGSGAIGPEFLVNETTDGDQHHSSVALDADGDFAIAWTSYGNDGGGNGYGGGVGGEEGVFVRRYDRSGEAVGGEFVASTYRSGNQQFPRVAMDADGDFVVAWESFQDVDAGTLQPTSYGIYLQRYVRNELVGTSTFYGPNGELGAETPVNTFKDGEQRFASIALDNEGDMVIVWSGAGPTDTSGVYMRRLEKAEDETGPWITDVLIEIDGEYEDVIPGGTVPLAGSTEPADLVFLFGEDVVHDQIGGFNSVTNPLNWIVTRNGIQVPNAVVGVTYGLSLRGASGGPTSDAYEAIVSLDADPAVPGRQPLETGLYTITLRDNVEDLYENALDGNYDGTPGGAFSRSFFVGFGSGATGNPPLPPGTPVDPDDPDYPGDDQPINVAQFLTQDQVAMSMNDAGDYVVVWTTYLQDVLGNVVGRVFNNFGQPIGPEFLLSQTTAGAQSMPQVAMDPLGNFVATWAGNGSGDEAGIFARRFDFTGLAVGNEFRVNTFTPRVQDEPTIAIDADGDFVIAWTSYGQDADKDGVVARRFSRSGDPLSDEFAVNTRAADRQEKPDIAMDVDGDFVVVWNSYGQDGSSWGVYGQRFTESGVKAGNEFRVNSTTGERQLGARVAMDNVGNFTVVWQSYVNASTGFDIYAQRYNANGGGVGGEFQVNQNGQRWQTDPDVAMSGDGKIYFTWNSVGQDGSGGGIYARMLNANGSDFVLNGAALGEFRVNVVPDGDQRTPVIGADTDGDLTVAWVGPEFDPVVGVTGSDIYARVMGINPPAPSTVGITRPTGNNSGGGNGGGGGGGGTQHTWRNPAQPLDVNADGQVTALDVLLVVNWLNTTGAGQLGAAPSPSSPGFVYVDVNGDNFVTAVDALQVVNHLNSQAQSQRANAAVARALAVEQVSSAFSVASTEDEGDSLDNTLSAVAQVRSAKTGADEDSSDLIWTALGMLAEDEQEVAWA
jgi:hypothetical protein